MVNVRKTCLAVAVIGALGLLPALPAHAGTISAQITSLSIYGTSTTYPYAIMVFDEGGAAGCGWPAAMTIRVNTNKGRAMLSVATAAFLSGKEVHVFGTGSCISTSTTGWYYGVEEVTHIEIVQ